MPRLRFLLIALVFAPVVATVLLAGTAAAQPYVGFYMTGVPATDHQVKADRTIVATNVTDSFTVKDIRFGSSVAYGGVVGYQFIPYLAAEIDVLHFSPGIKALNRTANSPTIGSVPVSISSGDLDVTGLAFGPVGTYSLLSDEQVPQGRLQLYAGAGFALMFTSVDDKFSSPFATFSVKDSNTSVEPHVKAGLRWFFTKNLAAFAEFHYLRVSVDVSGNGVTGAGAPVKIKLSGDAEAPIGLVGISWHFR